MKLTMTASDVRKLQLLTESEGESWLQEVGPHAAPPQPGGAPDDDDDATARRDKPDDEDVTTTRRDDDDDAKPAMFAVRACVGPAAPVKPGVPRPPRPGSGGGSRPRGHAPGASATTLQFYEPQSHSPGATGPGQWL